MLQNINHFGSNYLIVLNHTPPTCSLSGLWNWKCNLLLAQQGYSKHENKAVAFFSFLPIKEHEHHKLLFLKQKQPPCSSCWKHLNYICLRQSETSGKNGQHSFLSPRSEGVSMWAPAVQPNTAADTALKKKKKKSQPQKRAPLPLPFSQVMRQARGAVTSFPIPSHAFPSHQLRPSCSHKSLQKALLWWQIKSHTWVVLRAHKHWIQCNRSSYSMQRGTARVRDLKHLTARLWTVWCEPTP